jgi:hypothetical protein
MLKKILSTWQFRSNESPGMLVTKLLRFKTAQKGTAQSAETVK